MKSERVRQVYLCRQASRGMGSSVCVGLRFLPFSLLFLTVYRRVFFVCGRLDGYLRDVIYIYIYTWLYVCVLHLLLQRNILSTSIVYYQLFL